MQLLDRYLNAVRFWLTGAHKDDIVAELSEDLRSAIADEEAALGRTLTEDDMVRLLKQRGHPVTVAAAYMPQRSLVGPALFPVYLFVLKVLAACFIGPWILMWMVVPFSFKRFFEVWSASWMTLFAAYGIVTIVFALIERVQTRSRAADNWDPRKLPPAVTEIPRSASGFELAALLVFGIWWAAFLGPREIVYGTTVTFTLAPQWPYVFWALLGITVFNLGLSAVNLARPYWTARRAALRLASDAAGVTVCCAILRIGLFDRIWVAGVPLARTAEIVRQINLWGARAVPFAILVGVVLVAWDARRVLRLRKRGFQSLTAATA